jgi:uncharacterized protein
MSVRAGPAPGIGVGMQASRCNGGLHPWFLANRRRALYLRCVERAALGRTQRFGYRETPGASKSVKITSPCIGVCTLDPSNRTCIGCQRTADEIARWSAMSDAERIQIVLQLRIRRHTQGIGATSDSRQRRRARKLAQLVT